MCTSIALRTDRLPAPFALRRVHLVRRPNADVQFAQLLLGDRRGRLDKQVLSTLGLWKRNHIADLLDAGHQRDKAIEAEGDAAMRWRAVLQRLEQETEFALLVLRA